MFVSVNVTGLFPAIDAQLGAAKQDVGILIPAHQRKQKAPQPGILIDELVFKTGNYSVTQKGRHTAPRSIVP